MIILKSTDIEDEIRKALKDFVTIYVRPLPKDFATPSILVTATGGQTTNTIDSFNVTLDARAETDSEAYDLIRTAQGLLEEQARRQTGVLRNATTNSLARWGNDPVRPDLKLCTATMTVIAHRESVNIDES